MTSPIGLTFEERIQSLIRDLHATASATVTLSMWAGSVLVIDLFGVAERQVTRWEALALGVADDGDAWCRVRSGVLRAANSDSSGLVVAEVTSTLLEDRLPAAVRGELSIGGVPLGIALARHAADGGYHVRRRSHVQRVWMTGVGGEPIVIRAQSRIDVWSTPVALTQELVPAAFIHYLEGCPGLTPNSSTNSRIKINSAAPTYNNI